MSTARLRWSDVALAFDPELNGALPDLWVRDTAVADWQAVIDLASERAWAVEYRVDGAARELKSAAKLLAEARYCLDLLLVRPLPDLLLIFRPRVPEEIEFEADLRELQGQERLDIFCSVLAAIGRRLGKPIVLTPESAPDHPTLGYDTDTDAVVLLAAP